MRTCIGFLAVVAIGLSGCETDKFINPQTNQLNASVTWCAALVAISRDSSGSGYGDCVRSGAFDSVNSSTSVVTSTAYTLKSISTNCNGLRTVYDTTTSTQYFCRRNGQEISVTAYNIHTNEKWQVTAEENGDLRGVGPKGDKWTYSAATKTYVNVDTGRTCTGVEPGQNCT